MAPWMRSTLPYHVPALPHGTSNPIADMARPTSADAFNTFPLIKRTMAQTVPIIDASKGGLPPRAFNNRAFFALFALLAVAMVLASLWFFFWAKNGGFVWRKGDWEDYKSTVLRRKGKDGRTLSAATPRTQLGQGSIAGTFDVEKEAAWAHKPNFRPGMIRHVKDTAMRERTPSDDDVRAYRHEKAATVGGMNGEHDGQYFASSHNSFSNLVSNDSKQHLTSNAARAGKRASPERNCEFRQSRQRTSSAVHPNLKGETPSRQQRRYSFGAGHASSAENEPDRYNRSATADNSYYKAYRPVGASRGAVMNKARRSRHSSPVKQGDFASQAYPAPPVSTQHILDFSSGSGKPGYHRGGRIGAYEDSDGDLSSVRGY